MSEERKKQNVNFVNLINFSCFNMFFIRKVHDWRTVLGHVGGENKKKAELSIFFSCRTTFQHIGGLVNRRI